MAEVTNDEVTHDKHQGILGLHGKSHRRLRWAGDERFPSYLQLTCKIRPIAAVIICGLLLRKPLVEKALEIQSNDKPSYLERGRTNHLGSDKAKSYARALAGRHLELTVCL